MTTEPACDGLCVDSADIGVPGYGIAYPHPGCPLHDPGNVCDCGQPDRCLSPTHGQVDFGEALRIRHHQGLSYVRDQYQVPAEVGGRVTVDGKPGVIVGAQDARLLVEFADGVMPCHPKWRVEYRAGGQQ